MAKGQKRSNREIKKPKKEKDKTPPASAPAFGRGTPASTGAAKKGA